MNWLEALVLGLLQGLTEFLPVSSSGHLELGGALFGLQDPDQFFTFNVMVHGATFLSVLVVFRKDIINLIISVLKFKYNEETRLVMMLLLSAVPVALVGLLFEKQVASFFEGRIVLVGCMLLVTATILFLTRFAPKQKKDLGYSHAILIGIAQTIAVLPGISRSGATIGTALLLGVERTRAVRFSFLMVLLPIFGINLLKIIQFSEQGELVSSNLTALVVGTLAAFFSGLAACRWMISLVSKGKIGYFSVYCLLVGLAAIIAGTAGLI